MMLAEVKWAELGELLWVAPLAAVVVCGAFSLVILGTARAAEARRDRAGGLAIVFTALTLAAFAAFLGSVVYGIIIIAGG